MSIKIKQKGGDGYVINVNEAIGGTPAISRYSYNYSPIFDGDLLNGGGCDLDGCDGNALQPTCNNCGGCTLLNGGGKKGEKRKSSCGCDKKEKKGSIFDFLMMKGGVKKSLSKVSSKASSKASSEKLSKNNKIDRFYAIRELSHMLEPLKDKSIVELNIKLFLKDLEEKKPLKTKKMELHASKIQDLLSKLGKNNLLVLGSILLLHHFSKKMSNKSTDIKMKGGDNSIGSLLAPLGINQLGASVVLVLLQQAFTNNKIVKNQKSKQIGGNPLKNLIAPLGTNAFIATGLLIVLEKVFNNEIKVSSKSQSKSSSKLVGGDKENKNYEKLFNLLAPITFNTFTKKSTLDNFNKKITQ
jgi:hypothetical protein